MLLSKSLLSSLKTILLIISLLRLGIHHFKNGKKPTALILTFLCFSFIKCSKGITSTYLRGLVWRWNGVYMHSAFRQVFTKKKALKLFQGSFISIIIRTTPAFCFYFFSEVRILNMYLTLFDSRLACHNMNTEPPKKCTMKAWLANAYNSTYFMPNSIQSTFHVLNQLILKTKPWSRYHYPHFTDQEAEVQLGPGSLSS